MYEFLIWGFITGVACWAWKALHVEHLLPRHAAFSLFLLLLDSGVSVAVVCLHSSLGRRNGRTILPATPSSSYRFRQLPWLVTLSLSLPALQYNNPHSLSLISFFRFSQWWFRYRFSQSLPSSTHYQVISILLLFLYFFNSIHSHRTTSISSCIIYAFIVIRVLFNAVVDLRQINLCLINFAVHYRLNLMYLA